MAEDSFSSLQGDWAISGATAQAGSPAVEVRLHDWAGGGLLLSKASKDATFSVSSSPDWCAAHASTGVRPIIVAEVAVRGQTALLLPLEIASVAGMRIARHVGGSHANANFPMLFRRDQTGPASNTLVTAIAAALRASRHGIDAMMLERQLAQLDGCENPLVNAQSSLSPNIALSFSTDMPFEALLERVSGKRKQKKYRAQVRKFEAAGDFAVKTAADPDEAKAALSAFLDMKAAQFAAMGVNDPFARPGTRDALLGFYGTDCVAGRHRPDLHWLEVGGIIRAVAGTTIDRGTMMVHFIGFRNDEIAQHSPGDFLVHWMVEQACAGECRMFDFGVGDEPYKRSWCDIETRHFDTGMGLSLQGKAMLAALASRRAVIRTIKGNERLWTLAKAVRRLL